MAFKNVLHFMGSALDGVAVWTVLQGVIVGTTRIVKMAMGAGAAILVLALAPATMAYASPAAFVPCSSGAAGLVAAITAANGGGGGTINLAPGCTYNLTTYNNVHPAPPPNSMAPPLGANGLPVITSHITINGLGTTIAGNNADFRIFEVDGPGGNLTLQGLTITGGATIGAGTAFSSFGGGILNIEGAITLNHSQVTGNTSDLAGGGIASGVVDPNHLGPIGTLTLNFSQVSGNTTNSGGAVASSTTPVRSP